jgi:hypothetical protein
LIGGEKEIIEDQSQQGSQHTQRERIRPPNAFTPALQASPPIIEPGNSLSVRGHL